MITLNQLKEISGKTQYKINFEGILAGLELAIAEADLNTPIRLSHFLSQVLTETGNWHWFSELGGDKYLERYEGRLDLGNTQKGDGPRYKGRGWIMLTGRGGYTKAAKDLSLDLVEHPEIASEPTPAAHIAAWYWRKRNINSVASQDNQAAVRATTKLVNGGLNGIEDRTHWYELAKSVFGI